MARIGFVGLGNMGWPMFQNLVKAGHSVKGFDIAPDAARKVATSAANRRDRSAKRVARRSSFRCCRADSRSKKYISARRAF